MTLVYTVVPESELRHIKSSGLKTVGGQRRFVFDCRQDCLRAVDPEDYQENLALLKICVPSNIKVYTDLPGHKYITRTIPSDSITIIDADSNRKSRGSSVLVAEGAF